jgi:hypothetical protein
MKSPTVKVVWFKETSDVTWSGRDGKPRCAKHPWICLARDYAVGLPNNGAYLCAKCAREAADGER